LLFFQLPRRRALDLIIDGDQIIRVPHVIGVFGDELRLDRARRQSSRATRAGFRVTLEVQNDRDSAIASRRCARRRLRARTLIHPFAFFSNARLVIFIARGARGARAKVTEVGSSGLS
jgi:hypothetical protein